MALCVMDVSILKSHLYAFITMFDNRKIKRFGLKIPASLTINGDDTELHTHNYLTRDISSIGTFLFTDSPLPVGTELNIRFSLTGRHGCDQNGTPATQLKTTGTVIRTSLEGMAVYFDRQCQILGQMK